jgi:hypothetical protein
VTRKWWSDVASQAVGTLIAAGVIYLVTVIAGALPFKWIPTILSGAFLIVAAVAYRAQSRRYAADSATAEKRIAEATRIVHEAEERLEKLAETPADESPDVR